MKSKTQQSGRSSTNAGRTAGFWQRFKWDIIIILLMGGLLYYGASWQIFHTNTDAAKYECYAVAFWQGLPALKSLPKEQCWFIQHPDKEFAAGAPSTAAIVQKMRSSGAPEWLSSFVASQSATERFHSLPREYPLLAIFFFSLGMIVPPFLSQIAYAIWMILLAALVYIVLLRYRSRQAAIACALYFVVGGWATVAGRFDIVPAAFTLFALLCAVKAHWKWAFFLLAIATLLKFYPVLLLLPFLLGQQMASRERWYAWRRWVPLGIYGVVCASVMFVSLLLSVEGTLAPLSYFFGRPVQIESLASSLLWLLDRLLGQPQHYVYTFGSLNVLSPYAALISPLMTLIEGAGLLSVLWLQWHRKIDLPTASLLFLLLVLLTGKVFSPQYLIWLIPLLAYVGEGDRRWVVIGGLLCLLTTWIYPYIYTMAPLLKVPYLRLFYPVVTVRNFLLLISVITLLVFYARRRAIAEPPISVQQANRHPVGTH
ncbi:MAG: DUF2029 domain-containing protein [Ktedonobacteraceae bacterium]|nr:DUF2029 domain-containing protein [Ktedonobacteraceae bacterium]